MLILTLPYYLSNINTNRDIIDTSKININISRETFGGKWIQIFNKSQNKDYAQHFHSTTEFIFGDNTIKIIKECTKNNITTIITHDNISYNIDKTLSYSLYDDNMRPKIYYVLAKTSDLMAIGTTDGEYLTIYSKQSAYYHMTHIIYQLSQCGVNTNILRGATSNNDFSMKRIQDMLNNGFMSGLEYDVWKNCDKSNGELFDIFYESTKN